MHAYATDARDRDFMQPFLAVPAVVAALVLHWIIATLKFTVPFWVDAPSVMTFYGVLRALYDRYLWHLRIFSVPLSEVPDLRGTWAGELHSDFGGDTIVPGVLRVQQTWSKMVVRLQTEHSSSCSESATLNTDKSSHDGLSYAYLNEPRQLSVGTMEAHRGSARLRLTADGDTLEGDYFTGRGRRNIGEMQFHRISRDVLSREEALRIWNAAPAVIASAAARTDDSTGG